ncbi:MAG: hypothetical protein ACK6CU_18825 [Deltaproteobacteria bacterium]
MARVSLEEAFFAGRHREVVALAWDGPGASWSLAEAPYVAGALSLLGRLDESAAFVKELLRDPRTPASVAVEARFFALVGLCHAGRYAEATSLAVENLRHRASSDARARFFLMQGLALVRYFTGRVGRARRSSRRALVEAVASRFRYGRLLAMDLWGHALVQRGEVHAGLRTLGQAAALAASLGSAGHRTAIECAELAYRNRHGLAAVEREPSEDLEVALQRVAAMAFDNLYALRRAWLELAFRSALSGETERAREALERAAAQALPESDHRAAARLSMTHAFIAALDRTKDEIGQALRQAEVALDRAHDEILRVELALWRHVLLEERGSLHEARGFHASTGAFAARVLVAARGGEPLGLQERRESPLWSLFASPDPPLSRAQAAVQRGWWGLVPIVAGATPGRHLFFFGDALVTNDRGALRHVARLPGHGRDLLEALRHGERSKETLVQDVWRVPRYAPQLHDAVVHTAIARLRRALGDAAEWVRTTPQGYALSEDVVVVTIEGAPPTATVRPREHAPEGQTAVADEARVPSPSEDLQRRIVALLGRRPTSSSELAASLRSSEATVLRRLRELMARGEVAREGSGKSTRYLVLAPEARGRHEPRCDAPTGDEDPRMPRGDG